MRYWDNMREAHSGKYLGFPMTIGRAKNQVFGYLMSNTSSKLQGWKQKLLRYIHYVSWLCLHTLCPALKYPKVCAKPLVLESQGTGGVVGNLKKKYIGLGGVNFQRSKGNGGWVLETWKPPIWLCLQNKFGELLLIQIC